MSTDDIAKTTTMHGNLFHYMSQANAVMSFCLWQTHHQAQPALVVWAGNWHVLDLSWVAPPSILSGVRKGTRSPVMNIPFWALHDLRRVHGTVTKLGMID